MDNNQDTSNIKRQWVSHVLEFSSQYNDTTWAAHNVTGTPKVYPNYGDLNFAWAQASDFHANHYIILQFPEEVFVTGIHIYETFHAGAVVRVSIKDKEKDIWKTVWESSMGPLNIESSRIFSPELDKSIFKTNIVRLDVDCTAANSFCEIDAVELVGKIHKVNQVETEKTLSEDLKKLLLSEEFSDIQFEVEGKILKGHRNIITSRSDHFRTLLCDNLRQDRLSRPIHVDNVTYEGFKALLHYFYTNTIDDDTKGNIVCELIRMGDWYNLDDLKSVGFMFIESKLCLENVIDLYTSAITVEPKLENVENICLKFIAKNFSQLVNRPEFKKLPQFALVRITQFYAQFQK